MVMRVICRLLIIIATLPHGDVAPQKTVSSKKNLFEIWLEGDHYKWRAMQGQWGGGALLHGRCFAQGKVFGLRRDRAPRPCANPPSTTGAIVELKRYFGIDKLLDSSTAEGNLGGDGSAARLRGVERTGHFGEI